MQIIRGRKVNLWMMYIATCDLLENLHGLVQLNFECSHVCLLSLPVAC